MAGTMFNNAVIPNFTGLSMGFRIPTASEEQSKDIPQRFTTKMRFSFALAEER